MDKIPLDEDAEIPPVSVYVSPEIKKSGTTPSKSSKIVDKRAIVIGAIVILVLVILVIVLGALLGAERAKRRGKLAFIISRMQLVQLVVVANPVQFHSLIA